MASSGYSGGLSLPRDAGHARRQPFLSGSGGDSYLWNTGETSSKITVNPNRTTTYTLQITIDGITKIDSVTVVVENCQTIVDDGNQNIQGFMVYPNP
ncbi:MAG: hypothetical protein ACO23O_08550, partial [Ilumatobacteraceae bacterium]